MLSRYSQPKLCTLTLPEPDFRLLVACVYEAQHGSLAFSERRTDEHLSVIVQKIHAALTRHPNSAGTIPAKLGHI